jgi:thymidine kinase
MGRLTVITGPMFSGKSDYIIRAIRRAELKGRMVTAVKPMEDTRSEGIISRTGYSYENTVPIEVVLDAIGSPIPEGGLFIFDEVHLFKEAYVIEDLVLYLIEKGHDVVVAGLDTDFRGYPFSVIGRLMCYADDVVKLSAVCSECGDDARMTQRLVNGKPALASDPTIVIDIGEVIYEPCCRQCHKVIGEGE